MLKNVFSPIKVGSKEAINRFVVPAMVVNYCNEDGTATEKYISYHEAKAKGGWGTIITEDYSVTPKGKGFTGIPGLWDDSQIEGHSKLTERVHQYDSLIIAQIYHAGRQTNHLVINDQPVAPSPIPCPVNQETPHELETEEVKELVAKFGDSALRAKKAGFDGVEIHGGHGYLIAQFMSLYSNKRTDEYGGSLHNRMRFPLEIIEDVKKKAGDDFTIFFRMSGDELVPGGRNIEDTKAMSILLEDAGVDVLNISAGTYGSMHGIIPPAAIEHGWITDFAAEVKKVVDIPVITVGRINDPLLAESVIKSGKADLVAMGRASLADPDLPKKALAGDFDEIVQCIGCLQGCLGKILEAKPAQCVLNPALGREAEIALNPAAEKKKVFVAGGGPAGLEAAIKASERGHEVHLYEKEDKLGGQFYLASVPPEKGEITSFIAWQKKQLKKNKVNIHLNTKLSQKIIDSEEPDTVILATGSKPIEMNIEGMEQAQLVNAHNVLDGNVSTGAKVAVIGGGLIGSETANHLANHGKDVTIIEMLSDIAVDEPASVRKFLLEELADKDVKILTDSKVKEFKEEELIVLKDDQEKSLGKFDTIVVAIGLKPVNDLEDSLEGETEIIKIGDAVKPRKVLEAIYEGFDAGLAI
jgi:2,4-dienoyl-CoA reductase-like NADH-dependent reductase (Old Yellow Enzyme family)/thioredoxin reductase